LKARRSSGCSLRTWGCFNFFLNLSRGQFFSLIPSASVFLSLAFSLASSASIFLALPRLMLRVLPPSRQETIGGLLQGLGTPSQLARMEICYVVRDARK